MKTGGDDGRGSSRSQISSSELEADEACTALVQPQGTVASAEAGNKGCTSTLGTKQTLSAISTPRVLTKGTRACMHKEPSAGGGRSTRAGGRRRFRPRVESAQARIRGQPQRRQTHRVRGSTAEISSHKFYVCRNQCNMQQAHKARSWA